MFGGQSPCGGAGPGPLFWTANLRSTACGTRGYAFVCSSSASAAARSLTCARRRLCRRLVRCGDAPIDESSAWRDRRSVAQGIIGAPLAFAVMAADLINALRSTRCGIRVGIGAPVCSISYADDIVLMARCGSCRRCSTRHTRIAVATGTTSNPPSARWSYSGVAMIDAPPSAARSALNLGGVPLKASSEIRYLGRASGRDPRRSAHDLGAPPPRTYR